MSNKRGRNMEDEGFSEQEQVEAFRKSIASRILKESDKLVEVLFNVAYDEGVEAKIRLSAISTLLERSLPKMGVSHTREEETEERSSRKAIREDLEKLLFGEDDLKPDP